MTIDPLLIERIYEAAALPERWPGVLQTVADGAGSRGAVFITLGPGGVSWLSSPCMETDVADYFAAGWTMKDIASGVIAERSPGFRTETDFMSAEKADKGRVNAEFFRPRGYAAGACTVLQGTKDDMLMCVLEGFGSHAGASAAVPALDRLRPHLARAMSLTARLSETKAAETVAALDLAGVPAALVSGDGRLRVANDGFTTRLGDRMSESRQGLNFADRRVQAAFAGALSEGADGSPVRSIAMVPGGDQPACAMHLLPLKRAACDVFGWDGFLIMLAEAANASVPHADLLRLLFDLTPTEARLTRHLVEGRTAAEAAALLGITDATARTHLRRVFAKTGVRRQAELVRLLLGLGASVMAQPPPPVDPMLIERIYEAAALPELWPDTLEAISDSVGGFGATFVSHSAHGVAVLATPRIERIVADYIAEGWAADREYAAPLYADLYPGFRAESRYRVIEEIERLPVHVDFLAPRGLIAGVGTVLQGAQNDSLQVAIEGLPSHAAAEAAEGWLDQLRAPLARSLSLTARLREAQAETAVASLGLAGVAAAVVSGEGRLRAANERFADRLGDRLIDRPSGLRFADRFLQAQFAEALVEIGVGAGVRSIAVARTADQPACVIHLLPLKRGARDVFGWDGVLLLHAEVANASVPGADLLRLLFDLTPTEARLTRHLVEGRTPIEAAALLGITDATARTHLRRVFAKTGVRRQAELVRMLLGLGGPD